MPAPPAPDMALPRMNIVEFRATAQTKDPTSKIAKAMINTPWIKVYQHAPVALGI